MTVTLSPELEAWIERLRAEGEYESVADLLTDALSLLERHADLRAAIREGVESGPPMDGGRALNELRERLHAYRVK